MNRTEKKTKSAEIRSAPAKGGGAAVVRAAFLSLFGLTLLVAAQGGFGTARGLLSKLAEAVPNTSCHIENTSSTTIGCPVRQRRLLRDSRPHGWNPPFSTDLDDHCRCPVAPPLAGGGSSLRGLLPTTGWALFFSREPRQPVHIDQVFDQSRPFSPAAPRAPPSSSSESFEFL